MVLPLIEAMSEDLKSKKLYMEATASEAQEEDTAILVACNAINVAVHQVAIGVKSVAVLSVLGCNMVDDLQALASLVIANDIIPVPNLLVASNNVPIDIKICALANCSLKCLGCHAGVLTSASKLLM